VAGRCTRLIRLRDGELVEDTDIAAPTGSAAEQAVRLDLR
jgi:hypothetical protein